MADLSEFSQYAVPASGTAVKSSPDLSDFSQYAVKGGDASGQAKPFYDTIGANMTPQEKISYPWFAGAEQTAQDVVTVGEKAINGLTLGGTDYLLRKNNIQPPNFDNTSPENKSGLNLISDVSNLGAANKTLGTIGSKIVVPVAKGIAKVVPEGLKKSSYALMQSIVNQLPKEFKYGANAGRAMVKEGFSGDASDIKEQADQRLNEIKGQGDSLASTSNKPIDNSNAIKVIEDKITELQADSPRASSSTIKRLQDSKDDLLRVKEGVDENGNKIITDSGINSSNMTPKETLDLKRRFDDHTAWKGTASDDSVFNKTMQEARTKLKENLNNAVPGMKDWNQRYADLRAAQQAAGRTATRDQAGTGMYNMINNFVRGSIGMSTFGAMITGHGELAGEILAGGIGKEIISNPYLKSKLAQGLYGLSEADKMAIFKVVPWAKNVMNSMKQQPRANAEPVDAELVDNRPKGIGLSKPVVRNDRLIGEVGNSDGSVVNQSGYVPPGLPNNAVGRTGINPNVPSGSLPDPGNTAIRQPGYVPRGLPEPLGPTVRVGVNAPGVSRGLPTPNNAGRSPIPMKGQVLDKDALAKNSPPKYGTDFAKQLHEQDMAAQYPSLHPARVGKEGAENLNDQYFPAEKGNPNISPGRLDSFNKMWDYESNANPGGWKSHGTNDDMTFTKSHTTHSEAFKSMSGNSHQKGLDLMSRAARGEKLTDGEKIKLNLAIKIWEREELPKLKKQGWFD